MSGYVTNFNLAALNVAPGDEIVDIGCGDGLFDEELVKAGFDVTGVEPEKYLRDKFEAWAKHAGPGRGRVVSGTAEKLPFQNGSVQTAVITEVMEHVNDPEVCLKEIHRVIKPGGMLCLSVPTSFTEKLYWRLHPGYEKNSTHLRIFQKKTLLSLVEDAGFRVTRVEGRNHEAAILWVWHALLRSQSDHAGKIKDHLWVSRFFDGYWRFLEVLRLKAPMVRIGNKIWPKSWYVYCKKSP